MRLLGALAAGAAAFMLVGLLTGRAPQIKFKKKRRNEVSDAQLWLIQAGVSLTPRQFRASSILLGLFSFTLFVLLTGTPATAIVPAIAIALMPRAYFSRQRILRLRRIQESWPDGLRELVGNIQSNMSLQGALIEMARSGPDVLREAFARFPTLSSTYGVVPALEIIREELADPTSDRVLEVLILAHERGGGIVTQILADLALATTSDLRVLSEIETNALEQKINARAVFALPWLVLVALTLLNEMFREFYQSTAGTLVVCLGAAISLVGMVWIARLGREPVEGRVFGASSLSGSGAEQ